MSEIISVIGKFSQVNRIIEIFRVSRVQDGLIKGKLNLEDFAVGMGGTILFSRLSMPTHALYAIGKGAMEGVARNRGRFVMRPGRFAKNGLTNMTTGSFYGN